MGQGKQAKTLSPKQINAVLHYLEGTRHAERNRVIFLLSVKAGLRAKEIAALSWSSVMNSEGKIGEFVDISDSESKGASGRSIFMHPELKGAILRLYDVSVSNSQRIASRDALIATERASNTSAQVVVNMFQSWYRELGFVGASSHSGRRTFITNGAKKVMSAGGSLRDVQELAGHSSLSLTQRYIQGDCDAKRKLIEMI